jgi:hypothetical protein
MKKHRIELLLLLIISMTHPALPGMPKARSQSQLEISIADTGGNPLPCRVHLIDQHDNAQIAEGQPFWHDHFVTSGRVTASLSPGSYKYAIERGPEYRREAGQQEIAAGESRKLDVKLERIADLRATGWYCGDLHVHRPLAEIEQLMRAEDLDFATVITWWNNRNLWKSKVLPEQVNRQFDSHRIYTVMAGEDEREGGALLYFGLKSPLNVETDEREVPTPMQFVGEARLRNPDVWIDIEKPFWWDVPVWLASGQMNSIGVANNHMCRSQMYANEAWGKPRDSKRLPAPLGNGYWTQEIYYHMLNTGLRLPPSAGSASGVLPNPVGYNRVYVHLDEPFTADAWFRGLSRGRCFVTNGPLLLVTADSELPGGRIQLQPGERRRVRLDIQLTSQDPIRELALIKNGTTVHTIQCSDELTHRHTFEVTVEGPSWFLVRAIADVENTFRFAATAPWYVEIPGSQHHISRTSAQFFLDWVDERIQRVKANVEDESKLAQVLTWHEAARTFWTERLKMANAE